jgi:DNA-binding NtrC family response regulator
VAALQSDSYAALLPVLLFAHCDDAGERALDFGQVTFLTKPISVERTTQLIRREPGRRRRAPHRGG